MFLTCPKVKKQQSQATSALLQGKPGKVNPKWGCAAGLAYFTTSAAVTARFKKKNKNPWEQERQALMSVLK